MSLGSRPDPRPDTGSLRSCRVGSYLNPPRLAQCLNPADPPTRLRSILHLQAGAIALRSGLVAAPRSEVCAACAPLPCGRPLRFAPRFPGPPLAASCCESREWIRQGGWGKRGEATGSWNPIGGPRLRASGPPGWERAPLRHLESAPANERPCGPEHQVRPATAAWVRRCLHKKPCFN